MVFISDQEWNSHDHGPSLTSHASAMIISLRTDSIHIHKPSITLKSTRITGKYSCSVRTSSHTDSTSYLLESITSTSIHTWLVSPGCLPSTETHKQFWHFSNPLKDFKQCKATTTHLLFVRTIPNWHFAIMAAKVILCHQWTGMQQTHSKPSRNSVD